MQITYKQLHKLINFGVKLKVQTPSGPKLIKRTFLKEDIGNHIFYDDCTETKCSVTHYMETDRGLLSSNELKIDDVLNNKTIVKINKLHNQLWYDFEIDDPNGLYYQNDIIHHNSGKSMVISLIAEFFRLKGKNGLLLVPTINLLHQLKNDIKEYNLNELYNDIHIIGGGNTDRHFKNSLTISTWQSMQSRFNVKILSDKDPCDFGKDIIKKHKISGNFKKTIYSDGSSTIIRV
jgi:hypothetical protein